MMMTQQQQQQQQREQHDGFGGGFEKNATTTVVGGCCKSGKKRGAARAAAAKKKAIFMVVGIPGESDVRFDRDDASLGTRATLRADAAATPDLSGYITSGFDGVVWDCLQIEPIGGMRVGAFSMLLDFRGGLKRLGRVDGKHGLRVLSRVLF